MSSYPPVEDIKWIVKKLAAIETDRRNMAKALGLSSDGATLQSVAAEWLKDRAPMDVVLLALNELAK